MLVLTAKKGQTPFAFYINVRVELMLFYLILYFNKTCFCENRKISNTDFRYEIKIVKHNDVLYGFRANIGVRILI